MISWCFCHQRIESGSISQVEKSDKAGNSTWPISIPYVVAPWSAFPFLVSNRKHYEYCWSLCMSSHENDVHKKSPHPNQHPTPFVLGGLLKRNLQEEPTTNTTLPASRVPTNKVQHSTTTTSTTTTLDHWIYLHPRNLTCPLKRDYLSREYIFQPSIFRGHVSFRECISPQRQELHGTS